MESNGDRAEKQEAGGGARRAELAVRIDMTMLHCPICFLAFKPPIFQRDCPHAPCACPEPGCAFAASPPALVDHLTAAHSCPVVDKVEYGKPLCVRVPVPASERRRVLVAEEDNRVFVLAVAGIGGGGRAATAVSLLRVAASAEAEPRYRCRMWANAPAAGGKADIAMVDMDVASTGAVAGGGGGVEEAAMFLGVPAKMLHGEESKEIVLGICIDKKTS
uniref:SIAH-type domain-containing protein n=1 Tax=Leersia perrieri TaxID=77586 RepID=A0A0D9UW79_9ORYZ